MNDISFSQTTQRELVLAMRVESIGEMAISTGAALPVGLIPEANRDEIVSAFSSRPGARSLDSLAPEARSAFTCSINRDALESGVADHVQFADHAEGTVRGGLRRGKLVSRAASRGTNPRRVPRNAPGLCGSGRKFKNCCDAR